MRKYEIIRTEEGWTTFLWQPEHEDKEYYGQTEHLHDAIEGIRREAENRRTAFTVTVYPHTSATPDPF